MHMYMCIYALLLWTVQEDAEDRREVRRREAPARSDRHAPDSNYNTNNAKTNNNSNTNNTTATTTATTTTNNNNNNDNNNNNNSNNINTNNNHNNPHDPDARGGKSMQAPTDR